MKKFKPKKNIVAGSVVDHDKYEKSVASILEKREYDAYMITKKGSGWMISCGMLEDGPEKKAKIDPVPTVTEVKVKSTEKKKTVEKPKKKKKWSKK